MEDDLISREAVLKLLYSIKDDDTVPKKLWNHSRLD